MDGVKEIGQFLHDMKAEGVWFAVTGKHFGAWSLDLFHTVIEYSDCLVIVALIFALFGMAGAKTGKKYTYWTIIIYLILKMLGWYF